MKSIAVLNLVLFACLIVRGQTHLTLELNKEYRDIKVTKSTSLACALSLKQNGIYRFSIRQQGIAVHYVLKDSDNKTVYECNYPDDIVGYEKFEYSPATSGNFTLGVKWFNDPENTDSGRIAVFVKSLDKKEIALRKKIKKELEPENHKNVQTIDIDHFWEAYDNLKTCKSFSDSVASFQTLYLDRATNGLLDFIRVREFTAEGFVEAVSKHAQFYQSVRPNTYEAKKAEPVIEDLYGRFKEIYPNFRPFKVCFAVGMKNTGGTVSNDFVLIGTELATSTEGTNTSSGNGIVQKIKHFVAHECVHTQQRNSMDTTAIRCELLYKTLKEGSCDFIAELIIGTPRINEYGDKNENRLWTEFKNELCNQNISNWLYKGSSAKDKPPDLGYYIGYKIAQEYYRHATDKKQAIVGIIEMDNPIQFLDRSRYDSKEKR